MPNPRLATRYAKSILDLSIEKDQLEKVYSDMEWLRDVCNGSRDFVNLLRSPVIPKDKKQKIVAAVTQDHLTTITASFITLLIRKNRESNLPEIAIAFIRQYKQYKNIYTVRLTTAVPVSNQIREQFIQQLQETTPMKNIELQTEVNKDLVGGFVLQAGDKMIDNSIAHNLRTIARQFENNDFIYKVR
jgi:F-type H+-transporting ATPase subunit delta